MDKDKTYTITYNHIKSICTYRNSKCNHPYAHSRKNKCQECLCPFIKYDIKWINEFYEKQA